MKSLHLFVFCFAVAGERIFIETHSIESKLLLRQEKYCLQVCTYTFQPEKFTGWGSEGVNCYFYTQHTVGAAFVSLVSLVSFFNLPSCAPLIFIY